ncbi:chemoreceptor glutamine deamidase CheD [Collibacillus ludicampi]|jgi:chemotaxis protein CheD|uniref:Probable chemoreceptor glutamine deamidase CheD n=1 Tax=Collibacillus ludicampi TaxID=2771369 RepID=A0AAV4LJ68_9BACL|nr:chemotaxis protein CheD [Collibacillus ludicampi]GIM47824.1 chemoreceptor glutamine deamidase CheD [Collibacillus ludicampi]
MNVVKVGIADLNVVDTPDVIRTTGLGSCVGVVLYDPTCKMAGMAHVMLPESPSTENNVNRGKYANTAVPYLVEWMEKRGARKRNMWAKLAGGAQMFTFAGQSDLMRIGPRNVEAVKMALSRLGIPVMGEDTGGNYGRTIEFSTVDGILTVRTARRGIISV